MGEGGGERGFRGTVRGASPYTGKWGRCPLGAVLVFHFCILYSKDNLDSNNNCYPAVTGVGLTVKNTSHPQSVTTVNSAPRRYRHWQILQKQIFWVDNATVTASSLLQGIFSCTSTREVQVMWWSRTGLSRVTNFFRGPLTLSMHTVPLPFKLQFVNTRFSY